MGNMRAWVWVTHSFPNGIVTQRYGCSQKLRTFTYGNSRQQDSTKQNLLMRLCLLGPLTLDLEKGYQKVGLRASANSSCGWLHTTGVGQPTDLPERVSHILNIALFVIRWMKQSITCSFLVSSPGKSSSGCFKVWACRF
jgi:hypothetical protein